MEKDERRRDRLCFPRVQRISGDAPTELLLSRCWVEFGDWDRPATRFRSFSLGSVSLLRRCGQILVSGNSRRVGKQQLHTSAEATPHKAQNSRPNEAFDECPHSRCPVGLCFFISSPRAVSAALLGLLLGVQIVQRLHHRHHQHHPCHRSFRQPPSIDTSARRRHRKASGYLQPLGSSNSFSSPHHPRD